ncbi:hypothetical protein SLEP1_g1966 [Rubroshorea leprosula]|uniref:Pirin N-terminal domain-containing protein n=1 Tax=Rubroshorea leprosula TaxID=152421 RepID=A0AAV5HQ29_9ROSI|nr:hypothetical protein SLEP1_g1966 [Rubroshorea leprosula]
MYKEISDLRHDGKSITSPLPLMLMQKLHLLRLDFLIIHNTGFETLTYMFQGGITHRDFAGHKGTIHTGDQRMTAGRGIIHSEMPAAGEGVNRGLQLWINLSSKVKMIEPRYQELLTEDIRRAERERWCGSQDHCRRINGSSVHGIN